MATWLSAPMKACRQGSPVRVVRQEALPQAHAHIQPPEELRWTRGW